MDLTFLCKTTVRSYFESSYLDISIPKVFRRLTLFMTFCCWVWFCLSETTSLHSTSFCLQTRRTETIKRFRGANGDNSEVRLLKCCRIRFSISGFGDFSLTWQHVWERDIRTEGITSGWLFSDGICWQEEKSHTEVTCSLWDGPPPTSAKTLQMPVKINFGG